MRVFRWSVLVSLVSFFSLSCSRDGTVHVHSLPTEVPRKTVLSTELPRVEERDHFRISLLRVDSATMDLEFELLNRMGIVRTDVILAFPESATPEIATVGFTYEKEPPDFRNPPEDLIKQVDNLNLGLLSVGKVRGFSLWRLRISNMQVAGELTGSTPPYERQNANLKTLICRISCNEVDRSPSGDPSIQLEGAYGRILSHLVLNLPWYVRDFGVPEWWLAPGEDSEWLPLPEASEILASPRGDRYPCVRINAVEEGIYILTGKDLERAGYDLRDISPDRLKLYREGEQLPLLVKAEGKILGNEDFLAFANPKNEPDLRRPNVYWLTWVGEPGLRYREGPEVTGGEDSKTHHSERRISFLRAPGTQRGLEWVWDTLRPGGRVELRFPLSGAVPEEGKVYEFGLQVQVSTQPQSPRARLTFNGNPVEVSFSKPPHEIGIQFQVPAERLQLTENLLVIENDPDSGRGITGDITALTVKGERVLRRMDGQFSVHARTCSPEQKVLETHGWFPSDRLLALNPMEGLAWMDSRPIVERVPAARYPWPSPLLIRQGRNARELVIRNNRIALDQTAPLVLARFSEDGAEDVDVQGFLKSGSAEDWTHLLGYLETLRRGEFLIGLADGTVPERLDPESRRFLNWLGASGFASKSGVPSVFISRKGILRCSGTSASSAPDARLLFGFEGDLTRAFPAPAASDSVLYVSARSDLHSPERITPLEYPLLRDSKNSADVIVIAPSEFMEALAPLVEYRERMNHRFYRADVDRIYNEFSGGKLDGKALEAFLRLTCSSWARPAPQYVLFVGEANVDTHDQQRFNAPNLVPCPRDPAGNYASDDFLVHFNEPGTFPQLVTGRFPAENAEEVARMVNKVMRYERTPEWGPWRGRVLAAFDFSHGDDSREITEGKAFPVGMRPCLFFAENVPQEDYPAIQVVRPGAKNTPGAAEKLTSMISEGHLILQYMGHGGGIVWGRTALLRVGDRVGADSERFANGNKQPLVHSLSCFVGLPDYSAPIGRSSLAEWFFKGSPKSGTIGSLGPSWKSTPNLLRVFIGNINEYLLGGDVRVVGEAYTAARIRTRIQYTSPGSVDDYLYYGDPLLRFSVPPTIVEMKPIPDRERNRMTITGTIEGAPDGLVELTLHSADEDVLWQSEPLPVRAGEFEAVIPELQSVAGKRLKGIYAAFWTPGGPHEGIGFAPLPEFLIAPEKAIEGTAQPRIASTVLPRQKLFNGCSLTIDTVLANPGDTEWSGLKLDCERLIDGIPRRKNLRSYRPSFTVEDFDLRPGERREIQVHADFIDVDRNQEFILNLSRGGERIDSATLSFRATVPPDLVLRREDFKLISLFSPRYRTILVKGAIRNEGESLASYVKARISVDGKDVAPAIWIPLINPGGVFEFQRSLRVSSLTPVISIEVDPFQEIKETSKDNNRLQILVGPDLPSF